MKPLLLIGLIVASASTEAVAACPDYDGTNKQVERILKGEDTAPLLDAYEELGDAWFCAHPSAAIGDIRHWLASVSSDARGGAGLRWSRLGSARLLIVWARRDAEAGGRAVAYRRSHEGLWQRERALDLDGQPELIGALGEYVVIAEHHNQGAVDRLDLKVLLANEGSLSEIARSADLWHARATSVSNTRIRIRFERPPHFGVDGSASRPEFELNVARAGKRVSVTERPLTIALALLDSFCAASEPASRASYVLSADLSNRLPGCGGLTVLGVRRFGAAYIVAIDAGLVCTTRGKSAPQRDATLRVERHRGRYKVTGIQARGCDEVRARTPDDAF